MDIAVNELPSKDSSYSNDMNDDGSKSDQTNSVELKQHEPKYIVYSKIKPASKFLLLNLLYNDQISPKKQELVDAKINAKDGFIKTHKFLLLAVSGVIQEHWACQKFEKDEDNRDLNIQLPDYEVATVALFLHLLYKGTVRLSAEQSILVDELLYSFRINIYTVLRLTDGSDPHSKIKYHTYKKNKTGRPEIKLEFDSSLFNFDPCDPNFLMPLPPPPLTTTAAFDFTLLDFFNFKSSTPQAKQGPNHLVSEMITINNCVSNENPNEKNSIIINKPNDESMNKEGNLGKNVEDLNHNNVIEKENIIADNENSSNPPLKSNNLIISQQETSTTQVSDELNMAVNSQNAIPECSTTNVPSKEDKQKDSEAEKTTLQNSSSSDADKNKLIAESLNSKIDNQQKTNISEKENIEQIEELQTNKRKRVNSVNTDSGSDYSKSEQNDSGSDNCEDEEMDHDGLEDEDEISFGKIRPLTRSQTRKKSKVSSGNTKIRRKSALEAGHKIKKDLTLEVKSGRWECCDCKSSFFSSSDLVNHQNEKCRSEIANCYVLWSRFCKICLSSYPDTTDSKFLSHVEKCKLKQIENESYSFAKLRAFSIVITKIPNEIFQTHMKKQGLKAVKKVSAGKVPEVNKKVERGRQSRGRPTKDIVESPKKVTSPKKVESPKKVFAVNRDDVIFKKPAPKPPPKSIKKPFPLPNSTNNNQKQVRFQVPICYKSMDKLRSTMQGSFPSFDKIHTRSSTRKEKSSKVNKPGITLKIKTGQDKAFIIETNDSKNDTTRKRTRNMNESELDSSESSPINQPRQNNNDNGYRKRVKTIDLPKKEITYTAKTFIDEEECKVIKRYIDNPNHPESIASLKGSICFGINKIQFEPSNQNKKPNENLNAGKSLNAKKSSTADLIKVNTTINNNEKVLDNNGIQQTESSSLIRISLPESTSSSETSQAYCLSLIEQGESSSSYNKTPLSVIGENIHESRINAESPSTTAEITTNKENENNEMPTINVEVSLSAIQSIGSNEKDLNIKKQSSNVESSSTVSNSTNTSQTSACNKKDINLESTPYKEISATATKAINKEKDVNLESISYKEVSATATEAINKEKDLESSPFKEIFSTVKETINKEKDKNLASVSNDNFPSSNNESAPKIIFGFDDSGVGNYDDFFKCDNCKDIFKTKRMLDLHFCEAEF